MTVYNETVVAITGTATMTANASLTMRPSVNSITGTATMSAEANRTMRPGAESITGNATASANAVYSMKPQAITGTATMTAKSLKAIKTGLANGKMDSFVMGGKMYFLNGGNYFSYGGVKCEEVTPYIPTLSVSRLPAGGGESFEDFNLLGAGFKDSFSADGTSTDYYLSLKGLDATALTAVVNNENKVEGTDFTVDRTSGKVTFTTAPTTGANNVVITAYKTQSGFADRIKKCRFHAIFGGSNDTRVFVSGNPDMPDYIWRSGLYNPSYFPENGFYKFPDKVMGFSKQYDYLVVERANGKHQVAYAMDANGVASFPSKPINDEIGTIATRSIQSVDNSPVSLSRNGLYMLMATNVRDERNAIHLSERVDAKLLKEPNLDKAVSIDYDKKYYLAVNGNVYVFDYMLKEWYLYDNIHASCFFERDRELYFGSDTDGLIYRFKKDSELKAYEDDGLPINAYWVSKLFDFGVPEYRKVIQKIFINMQPGKHTSVNVYGRSDRKSETLILKSRMDQFNFFYMDFNRFSFITSDIPQEVGKKIKMKKVTHFQMRLENNAIDESLGLIGVSVKYAFQSEVK